MRTKYRDLQRKFPHSVEIPENSHTVKPLISGNTEQWTPLNKGKKLEDRTKLVQIPYKRPFK